MNGMEVASHTYDLGEYLLSLYRHGELDLQLKPVTDRMAYYVPCHRKQQRIGQPWAELLGCVPDIPLQTVGIQPLEPGRR